MKNYFILFSLILLTACGSAKLPGKERKIYFGMGGGFTGAVTTYALSSYGVLTKLNMKGETDTTYKVKLKKKFLVNIFKEVDSLHSSTMGFKNPGNMYKFLNIGGELNGNPDYMWGQEKFTPPTSVVKVYNELMHLIPGERAD